MIQLSDTYQQIHKTRYNGCKRIPHIPLNSCAWNIDPKVAKCHI